MKNLLLTIGLFAFLGTVLMVLTMTAPPLMALAALYIIWKL